MNHKRFILFRWWKHWQLDIRLSNRFLSIGLNWREGVRPVAYLSPDATPTHPMTRGWSPRV
jgi:hypothetical protein